MKKLKSLILAVEKLLFPPKCVLCEGLMTEDGRDICIECENAAMVFFHEPWKIKHVKSWIVKWQYTGSVRSSLVRYKFMHRRNYCSTYARELVQKINSSNIRYDVITWVPISYLRLIERGYDQVELLAREVGRILEQAPVKLLHKYRHNRRQSGIRGLLARQRNVYGVYKVLKPEQIKGKRILLLEDIVTTGATVSECARMLKEAGAKEVHVACVAVASKYV